MTGRQVGRQRIDARRDSRRMAGQVSPRAIPSDPTKDNDLFERYLPAHFLARLPMDGRAWRGRTVLLLWALGYPLEMAWSLGMGADRDQAREFEQLMARLDDQRLIVQLDASAEARGDGSHLEFVPFGLVRAIDD